MTQGSTLYLLIPLAIDWLLPLAALLALCCHAQDEELPLLPQVLALRPTSNLGRCEALHGQLQGCPAPLSTLAKPLMVSKLGPGAALCCCGLACNDALAPLLPAAPGTLPVQAQGVASADCWPPTPCEALCCHAPAEAGCPICLLLWPTLMACAQGALLRSQPAHSGHGRQLACSPPPAAARSLQMQLPEMLDSRFCHPLDLTSQSLHPSCFMPPLT